MARRPDDDDFQDLRNLDVDDIFENDDGDFELENATEDDYESEDLDDEMKKYLFNDDDSEEDEDDDEESTDENLQLNFDDTIETTIEDNIDDSEEEVSNNETKTKEDEVKTELEESEIENKNSEESEIEIKTDEPAFNQDGTINENADPMLEINDSEDEKHEETSEEVIETTVDEVKEFGEETENNEQIVEEVKPNCETFNELLDSEMENAKKYDHCVNDDDRVCIDNLATEFKKLLKMYYTKYREDDLINYIKDFIKDEDKKRLFNDIYIMQYCKYSIAIDFNNELAEQNLWVLAAGMFADHIEEEKLAGDIESEVISEGAKFNPNNIVEDRGVTLTKEYQKAQEAKYAQYKLDRTIFNISELEDDENSSIFDDKRTLHRDFYESEFYSIHKEVMTTDKFADMSTIYSNVIINEATSYIPVIDYSTGIRVVCIDTSDTDQYRLNPLIISKKVPFSFQYNMRNVKVRVLYLDDAKYRPMAVICALKKLIAFKQIKSRYKITLAHNYVVAYTTEAKWIEMFEKGDPDAHRRSPENSTYYMSKPSNMCIGIVVLDKKSEKDIRNIRRHQISRDIGKYEPVSADDYNIQFVLSARLSRNDLRLRNPTIPRENRYVEYTITQYNECNPVIIGDGFQTLVACIIREHKNNYDPGTPYSISFEYDRDSLLTPAVIRLLDEQNGLEPAYGQRPNSLDIDGMFTLPPSRIKMGGVEEFELGRLDKRYFTPASIQRKYDKPLWANYDLSTRDGRIQFIRSRGFDEFLHLKPVLFDVMPYALNMLESSEMFRELIKVSVPMLSDRNSTDSEAVLLKQAELNYKKSLGDSPNGKFKMFMIEAFNTIIDIMAEKNKTK